MPTIHFETKKGEIVAHDFEFRFLSNRRRGEVVRLAAADDGNDTMLNELMHAILICDSKTDFLDAHVEECRQAVADFFGQSQMRMNGA